MDDETWWWKNDRIQKINNYVEEFRGWHDDTPELPPELKVVNITKEVYDNEIYNSKTPWIMSFVKRYKTEAHLVHSEELF